MNSRATTPRDPINQTILFNHPLVIEHAQRYIQLLSQITPTNTLPFPAFVEVDPYETAPLSAVFGYWANSVHPVQVSVYDTLNSNNNIVRYEYTPTLGPNLLPVVGLRANANNVVEIVDGSGQQVNFSGLNTGPLPPVNVAIEVGFLIYEATIPRTEQYLSELYFSANWGRYNVAYDGTGTIRWYTNERIPSWNIDRMSDGTFLSTDPNFDFMKQMFRFDITGRVWGVYQLDNEIHHSILQLSPNSIIAPSEYSGENLRPGEAPEDSTNEDGVTIISLDTGLETAYYDMIDVMDFERIPRPSFEDILPYDWLHINQSYKDVKNNLVISSGRHQGSVFGVDADTNELRFILGNRQGWRTEFEHHLLTPVDALGIPLYDLESPEGIDRADKEFWSWGQHNCTEVPNDEPGIVDMFVLDNGNYRSREDVNSIYPGDNYSRVVRYRINLNNMTVQLLFEYGQIMGPRGYSSFVCNAQVTATGTLFINFGGILVNENGRSETLHPGFSDLIDPLNGNELQGIIIHQELDIASGLVLCEVVSTSGASRSLEVDGPRWRVDVNNFRALKLHILHV